MTTDAAPAAIVAPLRAWHGLLWPVPFTAVWTSVDPCASRDLIGGQNDDRNALPDTSCPRLCRVAALLRRVCLALAQVDGRARSASCHRHSAQLPLLRARLHPSWHRQPGPAGWLRQFAAYGDFATGVLAMLALLTVRIRPLFWLFVVAFNLVGTVDLVVDYYHAIQVGLPAHGGVAWAPPTRSRSSTCRC